MEYVKNAIAIVQGYLEFHRISELIFDLSAQMTDPDYDSEHCIVRNNSDIRQWELDETNSLPISRNYTAKITC